jgi:DNA modification methylase
MVLYAVKGEKHVNMIAPDVITLQSSGEGLGHPAAKPAAIYTELLRRSVKPGDAVFDPFCGTGPVFGAATELKCNATGVEIDATFYGISLSQLGKGLA